MCSLAWLENIPDFKYNRSHYIKKNISRSVGQRIQLLENLTSPLLSFISHHRNVKQQRITNAKKKREKKGIQTSNIFYKQDKEYHFIYKINGKLPAPLL